MTTQTHSLASPDGTLGAPFTHNQSSAGEFLISGGDTMFVGNPCGAVYTAGTALAADQRASVQLAIDSTGYGGVQVRATSVGLSGYALIVYGTLDCEIVKFTSGTQTVLVSGTIASHTAGDEFALKAVGTTLTAEQNGTQILSTTDATYSSGYAGIYGGGDPYSVMFGNFSATDELSTVALDQEGFRFGYDDGTESAHTWRAVQDANASATLGENALLRMLVDATDDPSPIAFGLRYQKNGSGGYLPVPVGATSKTPPSVAAGDSGATNIGAASGSWAIAFPPMSAGDMVVAILAWDDSTTVSSVTAPTGPNGETPVSIAGPVASASTEMRMQAWRWVATGSWSAGNGTFTPSASETCRALVFKLPAGSFDPSTPIGAAATSASAGTAETSINSPAFSAGASDGGGRLFLAYGSDDDAITAPASGTTLVNNGTGGGVGLCVSARDAAVADSESIASIAATIAGDSWAALAFVVRAPSVTNQVYVNASANIAAGGEATTARLTPPAGKTTGNFTTGRRWDDENGTDTIDIADGGYTELEWALCAQAPAAAGDYYDFRVYAGAGALASYGVTPRLTIASGAPSAPTAGSVTSITQTAARVNWADNSGNETGFKVQVAASPFSSWADASGSPAAANATYLDVTGLTANTTYKARIASTNVGGDSAWQETAEFTTLPNAPTAPTIGTVTNITSTGARVPWTDNSSNETGFKVQFGVSSGGTVGSWGDASGSPAAANATYFDLTGLSPASTYKARVAATNTGGDSAWQVTAEFTTSAPPPPTAPTIGTVSGITATGATVNWTDNSSDETGFKVQYGVSVGGTVSSWSNAPSSPAAANATSLALSGLTPLTAYKARVAATNANGDSAWQETAEFTTLAVAPTITTTSLPDGALDVAYSQAISYTGSVSSLSVVAGSLPAGLSLSGSTISGTPTAPSASTFTVRATNSAGTDDQVLTIVVPNEGSGGSTPVVTTITLVPGTASVKASLTTDLVMTVEDENGGRMPNLVPEMLVDAGVATATHLAPTDGNGEASIRVTGVAPGSATVTARVDGIESNAVVLTVTEGPVAPTIDTSLLPGGQVGVAYSQMLSATGDTPITWSVESGSLPDGVVLNASTGAITGTPTTSGVANFTVRATNSGGFAQQAFSITVTPAAVAPSVTTTSLPGAVVGAAYSQTLTATGTTPITWSVQSGSLPNGLSLNASTGAITGTPTTGGSSTFTVRATNGAGFAQQSLTIVVSVAPTITTASLAGGVVGTAYSQTLTATGTAPITWSITSGALQSGLTLNASTGAITGTPLVATSASLTFRATNASGSHEKTLTLSVAVAPVPPTIITNNLPGALVGTPYSYVLQATGDAPITWSVQSGTVPDGLSLNPGTGEITGTPTAAATANFTVRATNAAGFAQQALLLTVTAAATPPVVTTSSLPAAQVGSAYSQGLAAAGSTPITWSVTAGSLPPGLALSASTISGTPTVVGSYAFTVRATNSVGTDDQDLSITVAAADAVTSVTVSPAAVTIASNQTRQFTATVSGSAPSQGVTWSVVSGPGAIDATGLYAPAGVGTATIRATSVQDATKFAEATVTVVLSDTDAPTVSVTASALTVTAAGSITLTANAADNVAVTSVRFYQDGQPIGQPIAAEPFRQLVTYPSSASNGTFEYQARAHDAAGNSTMSAPLAVTVNIAGAPLAATSTGLDEIMEIPRKDTSRAILFKLTSDGSTPLTGVVPTISLSKNGGAAAPAAGLAAETSVPGTYVWMPSAEDVNTEGDLLIIVTAAGAAPIAPIAAVVVTPYGKR